MAGWPRWFWMWLIATGLYAACKALTWWTTEIATTSRWKHIAYLVAWPGMDAAAFLESHAVTIRCPIDEWTRAMVNLITGTFLVFFAARRLPPGDTLLIGWIGMIGFVLILHFGAFHLLSCTWRSLKCPASPLMNRPLASTSLAEFWGRRWNTAFRDLTHRFLFRPLASRVGPRAAVLAGFVVSGLVHDVVISLPAGGGYGGPTLFFVIQGLAVTLERSRPGRRIGLGHGAIGRSFVLLTLIGPLGLLFHRPFIVGVITPFMHAIGALP
jgi:membrane bound O-acyltransferase family protein